MSPGLGVERTLAAEVADDTPGDLQQLPVFGHAPPMRTMGTRRWWRENRRPDMTVVKSAF
jgi:hypothetical protein